MEEQELPPWLEKYLNVARINRHNQEARTSLEPSFHTARADATRALNSHRPPSADRDRIGNVAIKDGRFMKEFLMTGRPKLSNQERNLLQDIQGLSGTVELLNEVQVGTPGTSFANLSEEGYSIELGRGRYDHELEDFPRVENFFKVGKDDSSFVLGHEVGHTIQKEGKSILGYPDDVIRGIDSTGAEVSKGWAAQYDADVIGSLLANRAGGDVQPIPGARYVTTKRDTISLVDALRDRARDLERSRAGEKRLKSGSFDKRASNNQ